MEPRTRLGRIDARKRVSEAKQCGTALSTPPLSPPIPPIPPAVNAARRAGAQPRHHLLPLLPLLPPLSSFPPPAISFALKRRLGRCFFASG